MKDEAAYIQVSAEVRYWEDATVNGAHDTDGALIPCRKGALWEPTVDLRTGQISSWPLGTTARIHYKVCDQGEYWLLDAHCRRIAKWRGHYVPDDFLCAGENGYGDYIIFTVGEDGFIAGWRQPEIDESEWTPVDATPASTGAEPADKCECSLSIRVLGDGCRYCQPQEYIDRLHEQLEDEPPAQDEAGALKLLADIRFACGDNGRRMQPDLVEYIRELAQDAERYRWLRGRDLGTINEGGVFAGVTPANVVLNGGDLDRVVDAALAQRGEAG